MRIGGSNRSGVEKLLTKPLIFVRNVLSIEAPFTLWAMYLLSTALRNYPKFFRYICKKNYNLGVIRKVKYVFPKNQSVGKSKISLLLSINLVIYVFVLWTLIKL